MSTFITGALALVLTAGLAAPSLADDMHKMNGMKGASMNASMRGQMMSSKCPRGKAWVAGYKKKDGTRVSGYCRKAM